MFSYENIKDVKYISVGRLNYEDAVFYHYYFADNNSNFVETSIINNDNQTFVLNNNNKNELKNCKLYASCNSETFFNSIKHLFECFINNNDIFFKGMLV